MGTRRAGRALLVAPNLVFVIALLVVPAAILVQISLQPRSVTTLVGPGFTLNNYANLIDPFYLSLVARTLLVAAAVTALSLVLSFPVAFSIARSRRWKDLLLLLVAVPLMTSVVVKTFGWYIAMGPDGFIAKAFAAVGIDGVVLLHTRLGVVIGMTEFVIPFMVFALVPAIERVSPVLEEAAANLGARPLEITFRVLLPLVRPGLLSSTLIGFGTSTSAFVVPQLLGGTSIRMAAQQIFSMVQSSSDWPGAAALACLIVVLLALISYAIIRVLGARR